MTRLAAAHTKLEVRLLQAIADGDHTKAHDVLPNPLSVRRREGLN
jgi:hypothetical protein